MTALNAPWSAGFKRLYCDETLLDSFSAFHPISFKRVLPFQSPDEAVDDRAGFAVADGEGLIAHRADSESRRLRKEGEGGNVARVCCVVKSGQT